MTLPHAREDFRTEPITRHGPGKNATSALCAGGQFEGPMGDQNPILLAGVSLQLKKVAAATFTLVDP